MRDRERLIARIRHLRRVRPDTDQSTPLAEMARIDAVEARMAHLEQLVEGLQDSVHRESARHGRLIAELEARVDPSAMGAALDKDARERGL